MSRDVRRPNASKGPPSGRLTPGVARSFRSDGSDGDRKATSGVAPFSASLLLFLLLPALALADPTPVPSGLAECRRVERYAGDVAEAAGALGGVAATISESGRLHSLQRLGDRLAALDRSILDLERAVAELEGAAEGAQ